VESKIVLQELQKGYYLNKRLIRPAMVIVSKNVG
jgi:molecular chaperone GrpE (heat shock protein)